MERYKKEHQSKWHHQYTEGPVMRRVSAALYAFSESQSPDWRKPDLRIQSAER